MTAISVELIVLLVGEEPFINLAGLHKERAWNNLNNYGAVFLFLIKPSQEAHSCSTQRLRLFNQEQKDKLECSSYFMRVSKGL